MISTLPFICPDTGSDNGPPVSVFHFVSLAKKKKKWGEQSASTDDTLGDESLDAFEVRWAHGKAPREGVWVGPVRYPDNEGPLYWGIGTAGCHVSAARFCR
jgi:hypothetical protein